MVKVCCSYRSKNVDIQESMGGNVEPHKWNHGSASQREAWLTLGMDTGNLAVCNDTFNTRPTGIEIMPVS